jgi:hypothetical protein
MHTKCPLARAHTLLFSVKITVLSTSEMAHKTCEGELLLMRKLVAFYVTNPVKQDGGSHMACWSSGGGHIILFPNGELYVGSVLQMQLSLNG